MPPVITLPQPLALAHVLQLMYVERADYGDRIFTRVPPTLDVWPHVAVSAGGSEAVVAIEGDLPPIFLAFQHSRNGRHLLPHQAGRAQHGCATQ